MRAVLPGCKKVENLYYTTELAGPRVEAFHATPDVLEGIRLIELGKKEVPVLPIDEHHRAVVFVDPEYPREEVFRRWCILRIGAFSTCLGKNLELDSRKRTANREMVARMDLESRAILNAMLVNGDEDLPEDTLDAPTLEEAVPPPGGPPYGHINDHQLAEFLLNRAQNYTWVNNTNLTATQVNQARPMIVLPEEEDDPDVFPLLAEEEEDPTP